jgi:hypothetical protein
MAQFDGGITELRSDAAFVDALAAALVAIWCEPVRPDLGSDRRAALAKHNTYMQYAKLLLALKGHQNTSCKIGSPQ